MLRVLFPDIYLALSVLRECLGVWLILVTLAKRRDVLLKGTVVVVPLPKMSHTRVVVRP